MHRASRSGSGRSSPAAVLLASAALLAGLLVGLLPAGQARATAPSSTLSLTTSRTVTSFGSSVQLTVRLLHGSTPVARQAVEVLAVPAGATTWRSVGRAITGVDGAVRLLVAPSANTSYRARTLAPTGAVVMSASLRVVVRSKVTARWSRTALPLGRRLQVSGTVQPAATGTTVWIERYLHGRWHVVARTTTTSRGSYTASVATRTTRGFSTYRVLAPVQARLAAGAGPTLRLDSYSVHTYVVRTKGRLSVSATAFASAVAATYADRRGWASTHHRFVRVAEGGAFTVVLSQAAYLPSYSSVCSTRYSCRVGRYVIVNQDRWRYGSAGFTGTLGAYRQMVLNHETGHWLGLRHAACPRRGALAPVMLQQSIGLQGCRPNAWPLPAERSKVA